MGGTGKYCIDAAPAGIERSIFMKTGILGGTGKLGVAFALRLHQSGHEVMIGSRDGAKADEAAKSIEQAIRGASNGDVADWCDVAFIAVPYSGHRALMESVKETLRGKIIIDATVPIDAAN